LNGEKLPKYSSVDQVFRNTLQVVQGRQNVLQVGQVYQNMLQVL
jgi:hypothetical protein